MDASIFDSALGHTRRSDASEKREENIVSTFGHFRLWKSFASSPVSVNNSRKLRSVTKYAKLVRQFFQNVLDSKIFNSNIQQISL